MALLQDSSRVAKMSDQAETSVTRKRNCGSKVRTGCETCKIRRLKCDQRRPACDRCVSTGRKCPGYDIFMNVFASNPPKSSRAGGGQALVLVQPTVILADATDLERAYFDKFQAFVVRRFCGVFDGNFWADYVVKAVVAEPVLLHSALAFSASSKPHAESHAFATLQYSKAISTLRTSLNGPRGRQPSVLLLASMFLACYALVRGPYEESVLHLQGGTALLEDVSRRLPASAPWSLNPDICIANAFRRLDFSMTLSRPGRPIPQWYAGWMATKPIVDEPPAIQHVAYLRNRLNRWSTEVLALLKDLQAARIPGAYMFRGEYPIDARIAHINGFSTQWLGGLETFVAHEIPKIAAADEREATERAVKYLRIEHITASIMLETAPGLADGHETAFDACVPKFRTIVEMVSAMMPCIDPPPSTTNSTTGTARTELNPPPDYTLFTVDAVAIPPLYYTSVKCRHPLIRHRALSLLRALHIWEGAWNAQELARAAGKIIRAEEDATAALLPGVRVTEAWQVPEMARLREACVDMRGGGESLGAELIRKSWREANAGAGAAKVSEDI